MPIYYVICTEVPNTQFIGIYSILKVMPCTLDDMRDIWTREVEPLMQTHQRIITMIFYREPDNPVRDHLTNT